MPRRLEVAAIVLLTGLTGFVRAADPMTQIEFQKLIAGNTMIGEWAGKPYKQFFDKNHTTIYQEENNPQTQGTWRINEQGQYCSVWPPDPAEVCYNVTRDGDNLLWQDEDNIYPATIVDGKKM